MRKMRNTIYMAVVALVIFGCGGEDSNNNRLNNIQQIPLINIYGVNGLKDIIGAAYVAVNSLKNTLKIYQQDQNVPDQLLEYGSVYLGIDILYTEIEDVMLSQDWATVVINGTGVDVYDDGYVGLVSLQNHPNYSLGLLLEFPGVYIERAIAMGNWLVVASETTLEVYDISSINSPVLAGSYISESISTSMTSVPNGFYVFTTSGYVHIDYSNPTSVNFTDVSNDDLKQTKKAYIVDNKLYIGGLSLVAGNIKIARLDVSDPINPVLDFVKTDIVGNYVDFSIDDTNNYYVMTTNMLLMYREDGGVFTLNKSSEYSYEVRVGDNSQLYTWNSRIYTLTLFEGLNIMSFQ